MSFAYVDPANDNLVSGQFIFSEPCTPNESGSSGLLHLQVSFDYLPLTNKLFLISTCWI